MRYQSETDRMVRFMAQRIRPNLPMSVRDVYEKLQRKGFNTKVRWRVAAARKRLGIISRRSGRRWYMTTNQIEQRRGHMRQPTKAELRAAHKAEIDAPPIPLED